VQETLWHNLMFGLFKTILRDEVTFESEKLNENELRTMFQAIIPRLRTPQKECRYLPPWTKPYHHHGGLFVGTEHEGKSTNCSYGRYEKPRRRTSNRSRTNSSPPARDCVRDARDRWKIPIMLQTTQQLAVKVELLQRRGRNGSNLTTSKENTNGRTKKGIYVEFADGKSGNLSSCRVARRTFVACQQFVTAICVGKSALLTTQTVRALLHTQPRRYSMQHVNSQSPCASPGGCLQSCPPRWRIRTCLMCEYARQE